MIIDVHTHYAAPDLVEAASLTTTDIPYTVRIGDEADPDLFTASGRCAGFEVAQLVDTSRRIADMDRMGVDVQVMSSLPPFGFFYSQDVDTSVRLCNVVNQRLAEAVAASDRFRGLGTVPLQDAGAAVDVLEHLMADLRLSGVEIGTRIGSTDLDHLSLRPFFAAAERLGAAVFVHSTRGLGIDRLKDYHLDNLIGNPTEDAIAAASLIFGGVLDDFPDLRLYIAHGGGSCPAVAGRWDRGWRVRPEAAHLTKPPSSYLRRLFFDSLTHGVDQLDFLLRVSDSRHVMLGTDYPADMGEPDPVGRINQAALTDVERQRVLEDNAAALFGLSVAPGTET